MKRKEIQLLTRLEQLNRAKEIYDEITTNGTYTPKQVTEGFYCVHPDQDLPAGYAIRRKFIGYMQYLHSKAMKELEELFNVTEFELDHGQTMEVIENDEVIFTHTKDVKDPDQTELGFDSTITGVPEQDKTIQSHTEDEVESENQKEVELIVTKKTKIPIDKIIKPKRKYTKKKKS